MKTGSPEQFSFSGVGWMESILGGHSWDFEHKIFSPKLAPASQMHVWRLTNCTNEGFILEKT